MKTGVHINRFTEKWRLVHSDHIGCDFQRRNVVFINTTAVLAPEQFQREKLFVQEFAVRCFTLQVPGVKYTAAQLRSYENFGFVRVVCGSICIALQEIVTQIEHVRCENENRLDACDSSSDDDDDDDDDDDTDDDDGAVEYSDDDNNNADAASSGEDNNKSCDEGYDADDEEDTSDDENDEIVQEDGVKNNNVHDDDDENYDDNEEDDGHADDEDDDVDSAGDDDDDDVDDDVDCGDDDDDDTSDDNEDYADSVDDDDGDSDDEKEFFEIFFDLVANEKIKDSIDDVDVSPYIGLFSEF